jgi:hypothetical protein
LAASGHLRSDTLPTSQPHLSSRPTAARQTPCSLTRWPSSPAFACRHRGNPGRLRAKCVKSICGPEASNDISCRSKRWMLTHRRAPESSTHFKMQVTEPCPACAKKCCVDPTLLRLPHQRERCLPQTLQYADAIRATAKLICHACLISRSMRKNYNHSLLMQSYY